MKLVNQITVDDEVFSIIEMGTSTEADNEDIGPLEGKWICYNDKMILCPDKFKNKVFRTMFLSSITPEMTFETRREAELYAQMRIYQKAYDKMAYYASLVRFSGSLMQDAVSKIQDAKLENHFNHKEEK